MALARAGAAAMQGARRSRAYLLDYADATVVRANEAAFVDTRINAFADTSLALKTTWPTIASWTEVLAPTTVVGVADPFGGTDAVTTTDDSANYERHSRAESNTLVAGASYRVHFWIKKDPAPDSYPAVWLESGASRAYLLIDTLLGALSEESIVGFVGVTSSIQTAPEHSDWWRVEVDFTSNVTGALTIQVFPARSEVWPGAAGGSQGTATWYPRLKLYETQAWKASGALRIFADGAALIETARTNYVTWSSDATQWTKSGTGTVTTGQTAPDGSSAACRISDDDAAAIVSYTQALGSSLGTGAHVYSVFVLKDSDETRFPEFNAFQGSAVISGGAWNVQINTQTGATTTRAGTPTTVRVEDWGDWWRLEVAFSITTGGTVGTRIYPAATASWGTTQATAQGAITAWNVQVEAGTFASTPIRTSGAQTTRAADNVSFAAGSYDAATMATKGWEFDWWPTFASTDTISGGYIVLRHTQATYRYTGATVIRANVSGGTPVELTFGGLSHAKSQKLTGRLNMVTDQATLSGFTAGGGTQSFAGADDNGSSGPLYVGRDSFAAVTLNAVVSRLRRAA